MFTIKVWSRNAYRVVGKPKRTRGEAFLALSLVKGRARVQDQDGNTIATRVEKDGLGKLALVK